MTLLWNYKSTNMSKLVAVDGPDVRFQALNSEPLNPETPKL